MRRRGVAQPFLGLAARLHGPGGVAACAGAHPRRVGSAGDLGAGQRPPGPAHTRRRRGLAADLRLAGARINLIPDGDVAGVLHTAIPETGIDMYVGQGKAPEGVLAAAALRCAGGQIQARFAFKSEMEKYQAQRLGLTDLGRRYGLDDLVYGDTIFAATGVTKGELLDGVRRNNGHIHTHTMVMSSADGVIRTIRSTTPFGR